MSTQEIPLALTPQQAATGVVIPIDLPTGRTQLRIPPCRHGDLVRAQAGGATVLLRITVTAPQGAPSGTSGVAGCLVPLAVIGAIAAGVYFFGSGEKENPGTARPVVPTFSVSPFPSLDLDLPGTGGTPTREEPDPYEKGTCLNGTLPDSETAQSVSGVDEVSCSAADAHYKVIQTFPFTSDMNKCGANPKTQYAFSHRYTMNGTTVNEYVYCLVGLGSYARN
ncbi:LppU/SCO3897 family protein [Streptomyces termitum]|uniref:LppU/SCO3897 family protein n=1 Tax=Streptomyces termitum TaxID=67368 RepID=UPI0037A63A92